MKETKFILFSFLLLFMFQYHMHSKVLNKMESNCSHFIQKNKTYSLLTTHNLFRTSDYSQAPLIIKGIVKDKTTKIPLKNTFIRLLNNFKQIVSEQQTDEFGEFRFHVEEGKYYIEIISEDKYHEFKEAFDTRSLKRNYFNEAIYIAYLTKDNISFKNKISNNKDSNNITSELEEGNNLQNIINRTSTPETPGNNTSELLMQDIEMGTDKVEVYGILMDSITLKPIPSVSIGLFDKGGDEFIEGTEANEKGYFKIKTSPGTYSVEIVTTEYGSLVKNIEVKTSTDLGILYLKPEEGYKSLEQLVVRDKKSRIVVKGDTLQYDVASYKLRNGALLQDVIKNIPGLTIKGKGNLFANGEPVQKIKVDGKEFFGNDIQLALENLPADIITKIELFKESSNISKITGFKDGKEDQVLNLKIKEEYKRNVFGDVQAGYGSNDRYNYKGMANYLGAQTQFSLLATANNSNGEMDDVESFSEAEGETVSKTLGGNINLDKKDGLKIASNIRYSDNSNLLKTIDKTEYFLPDEKRNSSSLTSNKEDTKNTAFGLNLNYEPKSKVSLYFRLSGEHEESINKSSAKTLSSSNISGSTQELSEVNGRGKNNELKSSLTAGFKLNEKGNRALALSVNGDYSNEEGNAFQKSQTIYEANSSEIDLDQKQNLQDKTTNFGFSTSYTEPLNSKNSLLLSYSFQKLKMNKHNKVLNKDLKGNYSILDSTYTRYTDIDSDHHTLNMSYQSIHDKYQYTIGVNAEPVNSKKIISIEDYTIQSVNQNTVNYSSNIRFQYKPSKNKIFNFNYTGVLTKPDVNQITTDTTTISPTSKMYGNPNLKSTLNNNFNLQFQKTNLKTGRFLSVLANFNYIMDQVATYMLIDKWGNQKSSYQNVNGNWGVNINSIFNTPLKDNFSLDLNLNASYYKNLGFMNEKKNITNDYNINGELALNMDFDFLETRLQGSYLYNTTKNNQINQNNLKVSSWGIKNLTRVELPFDIEFYNYFGYTYHSGYTSDIDKDEFIWNISLSKKVLKKGKGEIRLQFYDILNSRNSIMRTVNSNYMTDIQTNIINRYFLLSFIYKFNFSK